MTLNALHVESKAQSPTNADLAEWVEDARARTLELVADLSDEQLLGPRLAIVNPLLWEVGHVAWFQEKWVLRHAAGKPPLRPVVDSLYDSAAIAHDSRWDMPLLSRRETLDYLMAVRDAVRERIEAGSLNADDRYFIQLAVFHEDMHTEAFTYTRQTLGYPAPRSPKTLASVEAGPLRGDVEIPGGKFLLGALPGDAFVFDNEKWAHPVQVNSFAIAQAPVTQGEFAEFVEAQGYRRREFWSEQGWSWRLSVAAEHPVHWRREAPGRWLRRQFDQWLPLEPHRPVLHVNWWEAEAFCQWAGRRLPTEAEWEVAASGEPAGSGRGLSETKRRFPWGDAPASAEKANLGGSGGTVDVAAFPDGDSAFGCRQMIGNVWEWTANNFEPYPGFEVDPYREYSQPWFSTHKVLRGGAWPTQPRLLRNTWRNFYMPDRRDVWAGFRTCRRDEP